MSKVKHKLEAQKNILYRDHYRRTIKGIVAMSVITIALTVVLVALMVTREQPKYFATMTTGRVVSMHSLSQPVITNKYLLQWASLATRAAFNINWVHYDTQLQTAKSDFTSSGWSQFMSAMNSSGLLTTVKDKKLQMTAVVSGTPVIINTGVVHGRFTWRVQLPVLVTFNSANMSRESHWMVTMNIQRISTLDAYKGIQISDFKAEGQI